MTFTCQWGFNCQSISRWPQSSKPLTLSRAACLFCNNRSEVSSKCFGMSSFAFLRGNFFETFFHLDSNSQATKTIEKKENQMQQPQTIFYHWSNM